MKCPNCQAENSDRAKFCGVCGQSLIAKNTCSLYKHENPQVFQFCEECGQSLTTQALSPTPSNQAPLTALPTSFVKNRYKTKEFFGDVIKENVYLVLSFLPAPFFSA